MAQYSKNMVAAIGVKFLCPAISILFLAESSTSTCHWNIWNFQLSSSKLL